MQKQARVTAPMNIAKPTTPSESMKFAIGSSSGRVSRATPAW